jgi:hypothetical protein
MAPVSRYYISDEDIDRLDAVSQLAVYKMLSERRRDARSAAGKIGGKITAAGGKSLSNLKQNDVCLGPASDVSRFASDRPRQNRSKTEANGDLLTRARSYETYSKKESKEEEGRLIQESESPLSESESHTHKAERDRDFEEWYSAYPRRAGKGQAARAYRTARKFVSADILLDGVRAYARSVANADSTFTKYPATWLNGQCWLDEPPPPQKRAWDPLNDF